jgi:hypothetical protein
MPLAGEALLFCSYAPVSAAGGKMWRGTTLSDNSFAAAALVTDQLAFQSWADLYGITTLDTLTLGLSRYCCSLILLHSLFVPFFHKNDFQLSGARFSPEVARRLEYFFHSKNKTGKGVGLIH